jgi:hypothetical protein
MSRRDDLVGTIVRLSPTAAATWTACPRQFRNRHLLRLPSPASDRGGADHGRLLHALLQRVHERGDCHDRRFVEDEVAAQVPGDPGPSLAALARHAERCPRGATALGHEVELARFRRLPAPMLVVTGRIDAIWVHDGLLDARDYKTGQAATARVADDLRARVQAWLLEPEAAQRGLRLRLRYEHLGDDADDPDAWDPDGDELRAVDDELGALAAEIRAGDYPGVSEAGVCRWCDWRTTCDESAAPDPDPGPAPDAEPALQPGPAPA